MSRIRLKQADNERDRPVRRHDRVPGHRRRRAGDRAAARAVDGRLALGRRDHRTGRRSPVRRTDAAAGRASPPDAHRRRPVTARDRRLVAEFLDRLDLHDVTLVGNDTGGAIVQLLAADGAARIGRIVLASCDAFDNFPPGLTGKTLVLTGKLPPALFGLFMQQMRLRPVRRLPLAFGWLTKRGDAATARWIKPVLRDPRSAATRSGCCGPSPRSRASCST